MRNLMRLVETIEDHEAINNHFYNIWMSKRISIKKIAIFARNYWELTYRFPESLAALIINIDNVNARAEYAKTLYSEMGNGEAKRVHSVLFAEFYKDLSQHLEEKIYLSIDSLRKHIPLLSATTHLINWQKELYSQKHLIAVGAQLALEWQAYTMIRKLYEGARNYMTLWSNPDKFHESCEFFYAHIGAAEKEHKLESMTAATKIIEAGGQFDEIEYGFNKHLDLIASFWKSIAAEMENIDCPILTST